MSNPSETPQTQSPSLPYRPMVVTISVIILGLAAIPCGCVFIAPIANTGLEKSVRWVLALFLYLLAVGSMGVVAWGLWNMKNWARRATIGLAVIGFLYSSIILFTDPKMAEAYSMNPAVGVLLMLVGLGIRGGVAWAIINWYLKNEKYFLNNGIPQPDRKSVEEDKRVSTQVRAFLRAGIVGTVTGVVLICSIIVGSLLYFGPALFNTATPGPGETPITYLKINEGDWKCYPGDSGHVVFDGYVENTGPYTIWNVVVRGALFDKSGRVTSSNTGYTDVLVMSPHSKRHFEVQTYNEDPRNTTSCSVEVVEGSFHR